MNLSEPGAKELLHEILEKVDHSVSFGELLPADRSAEAHGSSIHDGRLVELQKIEETAFQLDESRRGQFGEAEEQ